MAKRGRKAAANDNQGALEEPTDAEHWASIADQLIPLAMEAGARLKGIANAEAFECFDALDAGYKPAAEFHPGDRVRLTARALHSMYGHGRIVSSDAAKTWTIVECSCDLCAQSDRLVAVDELIALDEATVTHRHVVTTALRHAGQPYSDELMPSVTDVDMAAIQRGLRAARLLH